MLAIGLGNRVYIWSEAIGVHYPPGLNTGRGTHVTSISSSSTGGHNILVIGRNSGQISLYGLYDRENVRFQSQQPSTVSCLAFKTVITRWHSERFGCMMAT
ncbi:hypothetical protein ABVK25_008545 [Lepraria finkii]|uniref:Uncharacterized protein n=1 Tax=Lepraria finkii TaxID=1340010 RepID=A0ABR4AZN1_9LECA